MAHCWRVLLSIVMLLASVVAVAAQMAPEINPVRTPARQTATTAALSAAEQDRREAEKVVTIIGTGRQTGATQFAEDIGNVIEGISGNDLRVVPMLGKSESLSVLDMLSLKTVDMAIVDRDVLVYLKNKYPGRFAEIEKRINYVTKLYNTALHFYARNDIKSLEDLRGKKVSCLKEGSTIAVMCETVFRVFKIDVQFVYDDFESALQKVKTGEIAAAASGASPPIPGFEKVNAEDGLHFVPISADSLPNSDFKAIWASYLPIRLKHEDYPNMIPEGKEVPTIATTTLLAVSVSLPNSARDQRIRRFVKLFFDNISAFHKPPRHPKWKDLNLATEVRGWTRYPAAQEWLEAERKAAQASKAVASSDEARMKASFTRFMNDYNSTNDKPATEAQKEALFALFVKWWETVKKQQQQQQ